MLKAGLYVEENVSSDDNNNAVPADVESSKKFLLFNGVYKFFM